MAAERILGRSPTSYQSSRSSDTVTIATHITHTTGHYFRPRRMTDLRLRAATGVTKRPLYRCDILHPGVGYGAQASGRGDRKIFRGRHGPMSDCGPQSQPIRPRELSRTPFVERFDSNTYCMFLASVIIHSVSLFTANLIQNLGCLSGNLLRRIVTNKSAFLFLHCIFQIVAARSAVCPLTE